MALLEVNNLTLILGDKKLFNNASMQLFNGDKLGLTGLNGAGKSTFINMLTGNVIPDHGQIKWHPKTKISYLDQQLAVKENVTIFDFLSNAFSDLIATEKRLNEINDKLATCTNEDEMIKLYTISGALMEELESKNYYAMNSTIDKVASGLGLIAIGMNRYMNTLSGGQRVKVMLAKMLLEQPDVLILDEPTNFLDKEHIDYLTKYLINFKGSFILVSHDYEFLNKIVNCICDIDMGDITRYNGDFVNFENMKAAKHIDYIKKYNAQQKEIHQLEDYINKNIVRASTSAMAKSRRKKLEKMNVLDRPTEVVKPTFTFNYTPPVGKTVLWVNDLQVGYSEQLVPDINLVMRLGEKLAVTGFNGIGKSTFLKTICGIIPAFGGTYKYTDKLKIGYYEQENNWDNDNLTPLQELKNFYPRYNDKEIRSHLARCGLRGELAMQPLKTLSGGEQSKVKICKLILSDYNLLVLDEPTNHLDVNAVAQLKIAIKEFEGSVIFVSHSKEFCEEVADRIFNLESLFD